MNYTIGIDTRLWNETGVGRYIRNLVNNLAALDQNNRYILFLRKEEFDTLELPGNNFEKRLADIRWHTIEEQVLFPRILNRENLDLVHFPYFSVPVFYNRPYVVTIHDLILHHYPTGKASTKSLPIYVLKLFFYKRILSRAVVHAKKIIAVSQSTKKEIVNHLHVRNENIIVTYEGIDKIFVKKTPWNSDKHDSYFLYVGNAYPHKNLERLIEAFRIFKEKTQEEVVLLLVGRSDYFYTRLAKRVHELSFEKWIIIKNDVSDEKLQQLYRNAIALVLPSLMEGFGLPAIEAMSQGCLVLASDIPSLREICLESAEYMNPMDEVSIAEKLTFIYTHKTNFAEKKKKGIERAKIFSWETMAHETLKVYESCIGLRPR